MDATFDLPLSWKVNPLSLMELWLSDIPIKPEVSVEMDMTVNTHGR